MPKISRNCSKLEGFLIHKLISLIVRMHTNRGSTEVLLYLDPWDRIFIKRIKLKTRTEIWNYLSFYWSRTNLFYLASSLLNAAQVSIQNITKKTNWSGNFRHSSSLFMIIRYYLINENNFMTFSYDGRVVKRIQGCESLYLSAT